MKTTANATSHTSRNLTLCLAAACAGLGIYAVSLRLDLAALRGELAARTERDLGRARDEVAPGQLTRSEKNAAPIAEERDGLESHALGSGPLAKQTGEQPFAAFAQTFGSP